MGDAGYHEPGTGAAGGEGVQRGLEERAQSTAGGERERR